MTVFSISVQNAVNGRRFLTRSLTGLPRRSTQKRLPPKSSPFFESSPKRRRRSAPPLEEQTPLVSPGIRLPAAGGVFLLDLFQGKAELNQLNQSGADINKNMGGNILRGIINPVASAKQMIELKGLHAVIQSHVADPSIYVSIDPEDPSTDYTPETAKDHFRIVRCEEKKGNRVVGMLNIAVYGKVKQDARYVEIKVEPVSGRWVKVSPAAPLPSGEYALIELLGKQEINTFVWDFGVNAAAPANTGAVKPQPEKANEPPVLMKRKSQ